MYADINLPPAPLPTMQKTSLGVGMTLLLPLSRRGYGPGIILLTADADNSATISEDGVPSPLVKWAEEGLTVVEIQQQALSDQKDSQDVLGKAVKALAQCAQCRPADKIGIVVYDITSWELLAPAINEQSEVVAAVVYNSGINVISSSVATIQHVAGKPPASQAPSQTSDDQKVYYYSNVTSQNFADPRLSDFQYWAEALSHTRNLKFLKPRIGGPHFDLEAIWEEHTYYEFADRSVAHTMGTMVQEPYVNHVPTLTGGIGRKPLTTFYRDNFIFNNSADTDLELISRTVGIDRVIDEFIFKFTHDQEIDWLLPGVPPTYRKAEVPFTAVVNIRGDRLYHEHISWDQGTVLAQLGLMPEYLPFTGPPGSQGHKKVEYRVPVAGVETARKMRDRNSVPSNGMFVSGGVREAQ